MSGSGFSYRSTFDHCVPRAAQEIMLETSLYSPVKGFLQKLGFVVKGEIGGCDLLALSDDSPPIVVVCELKLKFNLELVLQGVDRMAVSDEVWLAAAVSHRGKGRESDKRFRSLCRRLGLGLLGVLPNGNVEVLLSPTGPAPRRDHRKRSKLIDEHRRRQGDPTPGGSSRSPVMTAYRQEALSCAAALADGAKRPRDLARGAPNAQKILHRNVYGWFRRMDRGVYCLTDAGREALLRWPERAIPSNPEPSKGRS